MSQCSKGANDFIKTVYGPRVAALCSHDAELVSKRNNLSFAELLRPFCNITSEMQVRDPHGQLFHVKEFNMILHDLKSGQPNENFVNQMLAMSVRTSMERSGDIQRWKVEENGYQLNINTACPWFEAYRDTVTSLAPQKALEFIGHFVACLLVVSSSHPNPIEEFAKLSQNQNHIQHNSKDTCGYRWMIPNTLKYYVFLHDNSQADLAKAQAVMSDLQSMYGTNACHFLQINSKTANDSIQPMPDPWARFFMNNKIENTDHLTFSAEQNGIGEAPSGKTDASYGCCLTISDHDNLRAFMFSFASKGLVPHLEKTIRTLHEQVASKKALHRSLFRATKTFFGGSRNTQSAPSLKNYPPGSMVESLEMQVRKIADLCFLCHLYELAFQFYHTAKKDFSSEQAWVHAASASEMAAVCNFMQQRTQRSYPIHYVDSAIDTYLTTCSDDYVALRCALVSLECLRTQGSYFEAATQLLRLTNDEDDLKSALLLEQVAHCYLRTKKPLLRKFAFHVVLAGHRYGKASQRLCALHCYESALQVYGCVGWKLSMDHINFTIGRHSLSLKKMAEAVRSFEHLIAEKSLQSPMQQYMFLTEYFDMARRLEDVSGENIIFSLPHVCCERTLIRNVLSAPGARGGREWGKLEEAAHDMSSDVNAVEVASGKAKGCDFESVVNEPLWLDLCLSNHLQVSLSLSDLMLVIDDESSKVNVTPLDKVTVPEDGSEFVTFELRPTSTGTIRVSGIRYKLGVANITGFTNQPSAEIAMLEGVQVFKQALAIRVVASMPRLQIDCTGAIPAKMRQNQIVCARMVLINSGPCPMRKVGVVVSARSHSIVALPHVDETCIRKYYLNALHRVAGSFCIIHKMLIPSLMVGENTEVNVWVQANEESGEQHVEMVFYYEDESSKKTRFRLARYSHQLLVEPLLDLQYTVSRHWSSDQADVCVIYMGVRNEVTDAQFLLDVLYSGSREWLLEPVETGKVSISSHGRASFPFRVRRNLRGSDENKMEKLDIATNSVHHVEVKNYPQTDIVNSNGDSDTDNTPSSLTIAIQWSACEASVKFGGQSYVCMTELTSDDVTDVMTSQLDPVSSQKMAVLHQLVKWRIAFQPELYHDFSANGACCQQLSVILKNQHHCAMCVVVDGVNSAVSTHQAPVQSFAWVGKALYKFALAPGAEHTIKMSACFPMSGTYNLNSFSVWAAPAPLGSNTDSAPQMFPQTSRYTCLAVVHDADVS